MLPLYVAVTVSGDPIGRADVGRDAEDRAAVEKAAAAAARDNPAAPDPKTRRDELWMRAARVP